MPKTVVLSGSCVPSGIIWIGIKGSFTCVQRLIQCDEPFMCLEQHGAVCRQPVLINGDTTAVQAHPHIRGAPKDYCTVLNLHCMSNSDVQVSPYNRYVSTNSGCLHVTADI